MTDFPQNSFLRYARFAFVSASLFLVAPTADAGSLSPTVTRSLAMTSSFTHDVAVNDQTLAGSETFISSMAQRAIDFLSDDSLSATQQKKEFEKLLNDSFDMRKISQFALGRYWRTASEAQQSEYLTLFKAMVLDVYSTRFKDYGGQTFDVMGARPEGKSDIIVSSVIAGDGQAIDVDWRVRYRNGSYKVIDVVIAGVSMGLTQRSDFSSVIQRGGGNVSVLIDHLRASVKG